LPPVGTSTARALMPASWRWPACGRRRHLLVVKGHARAQRAVAAHGTVARGCDRRRSGPGTCPCGSAGPGRWRRR
jgi:hypothetical protein